MENQIILEDEIVRDKVEKFFKNSIDDFEDMMESISEYKDDIDLRIGVILFPILGNFFHEMNWMLSSGNTLEASLDAAQTTILCDPNFENSLRKVMPSFLVSNIMKKGLE